MIDPFLYDSGEPLNFYQHLCSAKVNVTVEGFGCYACESRRPPACTEAGLGCFVAKLLGVSGYTEIHQENKGNLAARCWM